MKLTNRHIDRLFIAGVLLLAITALAYIPSKYYVSGIMTYWTKTDTSLAVNMDTANAITREYIIRLADSAAANRAGAAARGEVHVRYYQNYSNAASDSVNLMVGVNGVYQGYLLPYDMYLDRFSFQTTEPDARGPSTWRDDLPRLGTDSTLLLRLSRLASRPSGSRMALTAYKVIRTLGPQITDKTAGVFYDMVLFDEVVLPPAGTSTYLVINNSMKKER